MQLYTTRCTPNADSINEKVPASSGGVLRLTWDEIRRATPCTYEYFLNTNLGKLQKAFEVFTPFSVVLRKKHSVIEPKKQHNACIDRMELYWNSL